MGDERVVVTIRYKDFQISIDVLPELFSRTDNPFEYFSMIVMDALKRAWEKFLYVLIARA